LIILTWREDYTEVIDAPYSRRLVWHPSNVSDLKYIFRGPFKENVFKKESNCMISTLYVCYYVIVRRGGVRGGRREFVRLLLTLARVRLTAPGTVHPFPCFLIRELARGRGTTATAWWSFSFVGWCTKLFAISSSYFTSRANRLKTWSTNIQWVPIYIPNGTS
jgi:hypothetical protein